VSFTSVETDIFSLGHSGHVLAARESCWGLPSSKRTSWYWFDKRFSLSWLEGGSRCRNLPKTEVLSDCRRAYARLNSKSMGSSIENCRIKLQMASCDHPEGVWSLAILTEQRLGLRGPGSVKPQERRAGLR
jgi:hypothetical protein